MNGIEIVEKGFRYHVFSLGANDTMAEPKNNAKMNQDDSRSKIMTYPQCDLFISWDSSRFHLGTYLGHDSSIAKTQSTKNGITSVWP